MITDPDSSNQKKNAVQYAKHWRTAIETCGFRRFVYEKRAHLQCMGFVKVPAWVLEFEKAENEKNVGSSDISVEEVGRLMAIPQDRISDDLRLGNTGKSVKIDEAGEIKLQTDERDSKTSKSTVLDTKMSEPKTLIAMGIEGSANKVGVGILDNQGNILSNVRHTFHAPTG